MVGRAQAFVNVIRSSAPEFYEAFRPLWSEERPELEAPKVSTIYDSLPTGDFSKRILSAGPENLGVFCLGDVGWSDLGDPQRLLEVISRITGEVQSEWVTVWRQEARRLSSNGIAKSVEWKTSSASA
jgi:hypothetical protein